MIFLECIKKARNEVTDTPFAILLWDIVTSANDLSHIIKSYSYTVGCAYWLEGEGVNITAEIKSG